MELEIAVTELLALYERDDIFHRLFDILNATKQICLWIDCETDEQANEGDNLKLLTL